MNLKKLSVFWYVFSLIWISFIASVHAEKPIVVAKTNSVAPLDITFEPSSKGRIEGNVTGTYTKEDIENILFTIAGDFDGNGIREKHQFRHQWKERYREEGGQGDGSCTFFRCKFHIGNKLEISNNKVIYRTVLLEDT
ncbi:MAG: hypothetical protein JEY97_05270 [Bacteroidales bacterium]|nr:hypothetical protein [Bacteroidales bacterium]